MQNSCVWYKNITPMQPPPQATSCWQRSALQSCWSLTRSGATRLCALCVPCGRAWLSPLAHCSTPRCMKSLYLPTKFELDYLCGSAGVHPAVFGSARQC